MANLSDKEIAESIRQAAEHLGHVTGHIHALLDLSLDNEAYAYKQGLVVASARISALANLLPDAVAPS